MNGAWQDAELLAKLRLTCRGVFTTHDLQTILTKKTPLALQRRIRQLESVGFLTRVRRGLYVAQEYDLAALSQRLNPRSYLSFGTALAAAQLIGVASNREVWAAVLGSSHIHNIGDRRVVHVRIGEAMFGGYVNVGGVRQATPEKAFLDTLYAHQHGRRFLFDVFSDIQIDRLDRSRLRKLLRLYRNPKFHAFVRGVLDAEHRTV
jgi:hypothetical protein